MRDRAIRAAGAATAVAYAAFIGWLLLSQPRTMAEVTGGLTASVGVYRVDAVAFDDGLTFFRNDQFVEARAAFRRFTVSWASSLSSQKSAADMRSS